MLEALREPRRALALAGAYRALAECALADAPLDPGDALGVLSAPDDALASLLWAAYAVRGAHFGRRVKLCVLNNARSGLCPEDCGYCSQSAVSTAEIARYRLKPVPELVAAA
ncbi:MAG TPA: biotin synthase BioB, partial [Candidatus Binatia bacterium]|nr:biotin synthase BioB [Candidatus Binatia bacterium]